MLDFWTLRRGIIVYCEDDGLILCGCVVERMPQYFWKSASFVFSATTFDILSFLSFRKLLVYTTVSLVGGD